MPTRDHTADGDDTASTDAEPTYPVAETFYTLQGEGPSVGTPAVFLRFGGCNLLCGDPADPDAPQEELTPDGDDATWVCDTIEAWRSPTTYTASDVLSTFRENDWLHRLRNGDAHLVLTGGEPLLQQRGDGGDALCTLLDRVDAAHVEVETNGTIVPLPEVAARVDQFNVSVKLSNSGMDTDQRLVDDALSWFRNTEAATFKFVVSRDRDLREIRALADEYEIPTRDIMLMPAGASQADLATTAPDVAEFCKSHGYQYSPRLHIDLWDQATGV